VIWSPEADAGRKPTPTAGPSVRLRGLLQGVASAAVGALFWWLGWRGIAVVAWALGGSVSLAALLSPGLLYAAFERLFASTGRIVAGALTWVILLPIFYLFFYPFGVLFRRGRRDRLQRFYEPGAESYWEPVPVRTIANPHEKQY
jgi:hypothetical protein